MFLGKSYEAKFLRVLVPFALMGCGVTCVIALFIYLFIRVVLLATV